MGRVMEAVKTVGKALDPYRILSSSVDRLGTKKVNGAGIADLTIYFLEVMGIQGGCRYCGLSGLQSLAVSTLLTLGYPISRRLVESKRANIYKENRLSDNKI